MYKIKYYLKKKCSGINIKTIILLISIVLMQSCFCQNTKQFTVINDVRIFDGENVFPKISVLILNGKIYDVGKNISVPDSSELIDGKGKTLLPGLIDAHTHVSSEQDLSQYLVFGVTSVVDMGMDYEIMGQIKKLQFESQCNNMASMISAGTIATALGGHGTQYFRYLPTISKPEEAPGFIDDRIAEGSDFIKIIYDDYSVYSSEIPTLKKETITALIEAAHKNEKMVFVHIAREGDAKWVIEAGADGLAHMFSDDVYDPEFGDILAVNKAIVIPTLSILESLTGKQGGLLLLNDSVLKPYLTKLDYDHLNQTFPLMTTKAGYAAAEKAIMQLKEAHVPILAGTDAPNPGTARGVSLHRELELLVEAGLTPIEALKAATSAPATVFGLNEQGWIKPGYNADLLLVEGNPVENIIATRQIVTIWKNGVKVDRNSYREKIVLENKINEKKPIISGTGNMDSYLDSITITDDSLTTAIKLFQEQKYYKSKYLLETYTRNNSNNHKAFYYLGEIYAKQNNLDRAIFYYKKAILIDETNSSYHYTLGMAYKKQMDNSGIVNKMEPMKNMKATFEKVIEYQPDHIDARFTLTTLYMALPEFLGGSQEIAKYHATELKKYDIYLGSIILGEIYRRNKELDLAEKEFMAALQENKNNDKERKEVWRLEIALKDMGNDYLNEENIIKAIDIFQILTKEFPMSFFAFYKLGNAYMQNNDTQKALIAFKKSLELNPQKEKWEQKLYNDTMKKMENIDN
ncbi:amidohydrolase family protein [Bacteroidota bacterium]